MRVTRWVGCLLLAALMCSGQTAQEEPERAQRVKWWSEARFGMFIHWGLYAIPAGEWKGKTVPGIGEWIMNRGKIPVTEYEQLAPQFNPVKFNADEWVATAKNAGAKYIAITAKHHDGFAMYGSKVSKYNIVDATPFHRDPLKELSVAAEKAGMPLGFYYSQTQDWHEPNGIGNTWDFQPPAKEEFAKYFDSKVIPQVRELMTGYGKVALIWFDTPRDLTKEQSAQLVQLVHELQPQCLVSGRVGNGLGDYDSAGDNQISVGKVPREWETPVTMNDTWGFRKDDSHWKTPTVLVRQLATVASRGGNYLLNVGPTSEGLIPEPSVERLQAMGQWMKVNGESIYGTHAGPFPYDLPWGVMTAKPGKLYLHVFDWPGNGHFLLYGLKSKVQHATLLAGARTVTIKQAHDETADLYSLSITVPKVAPDPIDSVIALDVAGQPDAVTMLQQLPDGKVSLAAHNGEIHGTAQLDSRGVVEQWTDPKTSMDWKFQVTTPGTFEVVAITSEQKYGGGKWEGGHKVAVTVDGQSLKATMTNDGRLENPSNPYWPYVQSKLGTVKIENTGQYELTLKPETIESAKKWGLTLVSVELRLQ